MLVIVRFCNHCRYQWHRGPRISSRITADGGLLSQWMITHISDVICVFDHFLPLGAVCFLPVLHVSYQVLVFPKQSIFMFILKSKASAAGDICRLSWQSWSLSPWCVWRCGRVWTLALFYISPPSSQVIFSCCALAYSNNWDWTVCLTWLSQLTAWHFFVCQVDAIPLKSIYARKREQGIMVILLNSLEVKNGCDSVNNDADRETPKYNRSWRRWSQLGCHKINAISNNMYDRGTKQRRGF